MPILKRQPKTDEEIRSWTTREKDALVNRSIKDLLKLFTECSLEVHAHADEKSEDWNYATECAVILLVAIEEVIIEQARPKYLLPKVGDEIEVVYRDRGTGKDEKVTAKIEHVGHIGINVSWLNHGFKDHVEIDRCTLIRRKS